MLGKFEQEQVVLSCLGPGTSVLGHQALARLVSMPSSRQGWGTEAGLELAM
jgi:hypothetical protein